MRYRKLKGYKYQIVESESFNISTEFDGLVAETPYIILVNNCLLVKEGYVFDGPSGPTFDTKDFMRASLAHDAGYQLMREGLMDRSYRAAVDRVLRDLCLKDGMPRWRVWYIYRAVRLFAGGAVKPKKRIFNEIIEI